jgi:LysR family transcriptional regulator, glycine cleavage system transcriptional activator
MRSSLPPLGALRAFVSVARHLSFSKAAKELHVTPAAITHQIHTLERDLGAPLFYRNRKYVALTRMGEACLPELQHAFELMRSAVANARAASERSVLNVSVGPAFASKVLLPRLREFSECYPDIDIRLSATAQLADLTDGATDLAIRYGPGKYKGVYAERMLPESVTPMCAPILVEKNAGLKDPADLHGCKLIHDLSIPTPGAQPDWRAWLIKAGVPDIEGGPSLRFSLADLALQAAINGFGVVLGRTTLAYDDLRNRRLVMPFTLELPAQFSYFIVIPQRTRKDKAVARFRDWLMDVASELQASLPRRRTSPLSALR